MSVVVRPPSVNLDAQTPGRGTDSVSLAELIQRARNANGEERAWLCSLVNKALAALPAAPDKERQAPVLLAMLDDEALHALEDEKQVPCRAVAVEALLQIGYPWALQLDPDDVQFLREHPATAKGTLPLARIFSGLAGASAVGFLGFSLWSVPSWWTGQLLNSPTELALVGSLVLTMASAVPLAWGRPWVTAARWLMGLSSLVGASLVLSDGLAHTLSWVHLLLLTIPAFGLAATFFPRGPAAPNDPAPPGLPTAG